MQALTKLMSAAAAVALTLFPFVQAHATIPATFEGSIAAVSTGRDQVKLIVEGIQKPINLNVPNTQLQDKLVLARIGDEVQVVVDDATKPTAITALNSLTRPVAKTKVTGALFAAIFVLYLTASAVLWNLDPRKWITGFDKRYSNSQTQLALWFGVVAAVYIATNFLRTFCIGVEFIGGIALTTNLTLLTGFSAFTFGAAKMITGQKAADAQTAKVTQAQQPVGVDQPPVPSKDPAQQPSLVDLVQNDSAQADLGDLEMILITLAAVVIFLCQSFWWLTNLQVNAQVTLPDVDGALLSSFGLGQGAYLFKKAALPLGQG